MKTSVLSIAGCVQKELEPLALLFPDYHVDAANIYEALDTGVASCAVGAYAGYLLLASTMDNGTAFQLGYASSHGEDHKTDSGRCIFMGHMVGRLWFPGLVEPMIFERDDRPQLLIKTSAGIEFDDYIFGDPYEIYARYLAVAELDDYIDEYEVAMGLFDKIAELQIAA